MTNFHISESDWTKEFYNTYNKVKQDLLDGMRIKDIQKKYNISKGKWGTYRKELIHEGILKAREQSREEAKYYTCYRNRFHVQKVIDGKKHHIGTFKTQAQAEYCVRLMKECEWDVEQIKTVKAQVWGETNG